MIFQISIQPQKGNPSRKMAIISWNQHSSRQIKNVLGPFKFYQYLQCLFSDLSSEMRDGIIEFCNPGVGTICINWKIKDGYDPCHEHLLATIKKGLLKLSNSNKEEYIRKFHIQQDFQLALDSAKENTYFVTGEMQHVGTRYKASVAVV